MNDHFDKENNIIKRDLKSVGVIIHEDIYELVNSREKYTEAIPILINLLPKIEESSLKEGLIRALSIKEAKGIADRILIEEFNKDSLNSYLRWAIGNALRFTLSKENLEGALEIASNKRFGSDRQEILTAISKFKDGRVEQILIDSLDDDEIAVHAIQGLGRLKSQKAKQKLESLKHHKDPLIKNEVKIALQRIQ
jgi:HEAT repeat protein